MLKLIAMMFRLYRPTLTCRLCGYKGVADMSYRTLVPWFAIMVLGLLLYTAMAALFVWAAIYFALNWPVGIFFACVAVYFFAWSNPDLSCPNCKRVPQG
jgi:hypothetical protein